MRSREAWARSARDVSVPDAGLGQRLGTAQLRGVVPWPGRDVVLLLGNGLGYRAAILGVYKPVCLECQTLRSLMLACTDV